MLFPFDTLGPMTEAHPGRPKGSPKTAFGRLLAGEESRIQRVTGASLGYEEAARIIGISRITYARWRGGTTIPSGLVREAALARLRAYSGRKD